MQKKLVVVLLSQSLFELLLKRPALLATAEHTLQAVEEAWRKKNYFMAKDKTSWTLNCSFCLHMCVAAAPLHILK